jgi:hypothetical protein
MPPDQDYLELTDDELLRECDVHIYKASGPGGQHRNKASSAVRLRHHPTGISAHGDESRSQHENKSRALGRLRMNIATRLRRPVDVENLQIPGIVAACILEPRRRAGGSPRILQIGRKDPRFWGVGAFLLDLLEAHTGRVGEAAASLGITTGNFTRVLKSDRHLFAAVQTIRKKHGQRGLT